MGRLLAVFAVCYDLERDILTCQQVDLAAEFPGFGDAVFAADLAVNVRGGMRIRGALERIEYLNHKSEAGRIGGLKSGLSRRESAKQKLEAKSRSSEARGNPPDPVPDLPPDPVPDPVPERESRSRARRGKTTPTPAELASARVVLERLGQQNGTTYSMADRHVQLVVGRLREGISELELRAVIAYCADPAPGLGWRGDPKMHKALRPETLFGPESIQRYLDPARSVFRDLIAKHATQPTLALDGGKPR